MEDLIGKIAGEVWRYLDEHGEVSIAELKFSLGYSNSMIFLALGWLVREDKINLIESEYTYKISLK